MPDAVIENDDDNVIHWLVRDGVFAVSTAPALTTAAFQALRADKRRPVDDKAYSLIEADGPAITAWLDGMASILPAAPSGETSIQVLRRWTALIRSFHALGTRTDDGRRIVWRIELADGPKAAAPTPP